MKKFFEYILMGAGTAVGYIGVTKAIKIMQDPVKKTKLKRKFTNIKNELFKNDEQ